MLLPETATFVAVSGDKLATICRRFRQLLSPVWTGFYAFANETLMICVCN